MPRFALEDPTPPTTNPETLGTLLEEIIYRLRDLDARMRKLELTVNLDPHQPAQVLGLPIDEPPTDPRP